MITNSDLSELIPYKANELYNPKIAYFSMEVAIGQHLKTYSGGLDFLTSIPTLCNEALQWEILKGIELNTFAQQKLPSMLKILEVTELLSPTYWNE